MSAQVFSMAPLEALTHVQLARLRASLVERLGALNEQDQALRDQLACELSVTSNTFVAGAEGALAAESDDEVLALLHHEQGEHRAVTQALKRLDEGSYGACAECGEPIGWRRLQVLPEAALCVGCQAMAEHRAEVQRQA